MAVMDGTEEDTTLTSVDLEIWLLTTQRNIERSPFQVKISSENMLKMMVEGHRPNCYVCGEWDHMKEQCIKYKPSHNEKLVAKTKV